MVTKGIKSREQLGAAWQIAMVQMEGIPGQPEANAAHLIALCKKAVSEALNQPDVLVFGELVLPGYLLGDAWERPAFLKSCMKANEAVAKASAEAELRGRVIVFGSVFVDFDKKGEDGRPLKYNAALAAKDGELLRFEGHGLSCQPKSLLPSYREFDDPRYFMDLRRMALAEEKPLKSFYQPLGLEKAATGEQVQRLKLGIGLCEDAWDQDYTHKPFEYLAENGAELLVNLSCSPFTLGKNDKRHRTFSALSARLKKSLLYINQTGCQNNGKNVFAFDGGTTAYNEGGSAVFKEESFKETITYLAYSADEGRDGNLEALSPDCVSLDEIALKKRQVPSPFSGVEQIGPALQFMLKDFLQKTGIQKVVIGASGGIDSAVSASLFASLMAPENLLLVNMPSRFNSETTKRAARQLAENLKCYACDIPIGESVSLTQKQMDGLELERLGRDGDGNDERLCLHLSSFHLENVQARDRSSRILAALASAFGGGFTCNANKSEMTVGYSTLYGDLGGFLAPLGDLWKAQVYELGRWLDSAVHKRQVIPESIYKVVPSAELSDKQSVDEGRGDPLVYPYHDRLFYSFVQRWNRALPEDILQWYLEGCLEEELMLPSDIHLSELFESPKDFVSDLERWWKLYAGMAVAKRIQSPPVLSVSSRSFGFDHRESQGLSFFESEHYQSLKKKVLAKA